jgi:hypothetical protein
LLLLLLPPESTWDENDRLEMAEWMFGGVGTKDEPDAVDASVKPMT